MPSSDKLPKTNIDLFTQDISKKRDDLQNELKQYFEDRVKNNPSIEKNIKIQNSMINSWDSYCKYENLRLDNTWEEQRKTINDLYCKYKNLLDSHQKEFLTKFPAQFWQLTFELAIASLLSKNSSLSLKEKNICNNRKKISEPDLKFDYNNQDYFVECTSACSSLLDQFDEFLPEFEKFYHFSGILSEKNGTKFWFLKSNIEHSCRAFSHEEKKKIKKELNIDVDDARIFSDIDRWISLNRYACTYFKEVIPNFIKEKLASLSIPDGTSGERYDINFFIKIIALKIVEKLQKPYFQNNNAGVIAISLAMLPQDTISLFALPSSIKNKNFFNEKAVEALNAELDRLIRPKEEAIQEKILIGLENLYAIIIDTTWHNWFSSSTNYQNHYGVLYNENYKNYSKNLIFNSVIPYHGIGFLEIKIPTLPRSL